MANYNLYAVARGFNKTTKEAVNNIICPTWDEAKQYVVGVDNARYKGFMTEEEANAWMAKVSAEEVAPAAPKIQIHDDEIESICKRIGITRKALDIKLEKQFLETLKLGGM